MKTKKYTHGVSWSLNIESDYEDFDDVMRNEPEVVADRFSDLQELQLECFETVENTDKHLEQFVVEETDSDEEAQELRDGSDYQKFTEEG